MRPMDGQANIKLNTDGTAGAEAERLSAELMKLARDTLTVRFRFFDVAISKLSCEPMPGLYGFATDGTHFYYDPAALLLTYMDEPHIAVRAYLHVLLHCIFFHPYYRSRVNIPKEPPELAAERKAYYHMAADIAVERAILDMQLPEAALTRDGEARDTIDKISKWVDKLTAEKIYREFCVNPPSNDARERYTRLFTVDDHSFWDREEGEREEIIITEEQWKKISERVKTDIETFSKERPGAQSIEDNLKEATRERYDYRALLTRFATVGEEMRVNDDEFDYVYYTYGLRTYGNLPLVEALEYKEEKKVREFVIVIDTSASTRGELVRGFLSQTYEMLKLSESFFTKLKLHIIQADREVREDVTVTSEEEFEQYLEDFKVKGFSGTDFRPAFAYVNDLVEKKVFENLKGLIYFTDGYGVYPETPPPYETIFAFLYEDENAPKIPPWAVKVVIEED